jgi:hypothetical protein
MEFNVTREQWVERFAIHLANLEIGAEPDALAAVATRLWPSSGHLDPETAADQEFATRLRASEAAGVDFDHTVGGGVGGDSPFERTERIPVERLQAAGEYVRDNDEWIARCVGRVLELDPIIKAEEARRSVSELAGLERWRLMKPEAAAEQLYTPIKPRG